MQTNSFDLFESLVGEHYEALFRFACSLTHEESEARDLTQQTFYIWATKGHQLRDTSKARTWLFTTLHRAVLQIRRRQIRFPHHELEEDAMDLPVVSLEVVDQMDAATVVSALAQVDENYRAAVALFYLDDRSYKEIAAVLQVPIGTVKSRIARGLVQLRKNLSLTARHRSRDATDEMTQHETVPVNLAGLESNEGEPRDRDGIQLHFSGSV